MPVLGVHYAFLLIFFSKYAEKAYLCIIHKIKFNT